MKKITVKISLFLFCCLFFIYYSGNNNILGLPNEKTEAYIEEPAFNFKPHPIPFLNSTNLPFITAESYLVLDLNSFTPIISKNINKRMFPASTVKLATALVAYNTYSLDKVLTVNKVINEESKMGLVKNEKISALSLLYGTLVYSANDAAYTLAENYPEGEVAFIKAMNNLAKKIGMKNTFFTNSIGFDNSNQYTTAKDLALLSREFIKHKILLNITSTKSITVSDEDFQYFHHLYSSNQLLGEIAHIGGLKTGTTEQAGQNLISFYRYKNKPIIIILLKSSDRFNDAIQLINVINSGLSYSNPY
jgi:serine-type D-Ala-D-Ala carboxypeptidase (penicillin-binding protein 5/6)